MSRIALALVAATSVAACGEDAPPPPARPAATTDASDTAATDAGAGAKDVAARADVAPPYDGPTGCKFSWLQEKKATDPKRTKFALGLFHYNIEYVIGGLDAQGPDGKRHLFLDKPSNAGWNDAKVQDYIIDQTLRPILEVFERHPGWGVDIELQAMAIDVMAERHPKTLALLKKLVDAGQVELVSFHWAAQLFLAFPREDLERSHAAVKATMANYCLPLGQVVFNQEGQAGEGWQKMLVDGDWKVGVFPKNLWKYQHKGDDGKWWPLYSSQGGLMIVGPGGIDPAAGVEVAWHFFDDGELRAVGKTDFGPLNPYFAAEAPTDPARVKEYEDQLIALDKQGFLITRIGDYVRHLQDKGVAAKPAPPLVDGTWQAPSTQSIRKWLGGPGILAPGVERDNVVRSGNAVARMHAAAVQRMVDDSAAVAPGQAAAWKEALAQLWRTLWRAQVSDTSGINPWSGEIWFGLSANAQVMAQAAALRQQVLAARGKQGAEVDLQSGKVTYADAPLGDADPKPQAVTPPFDVTVAADRPSQIAWTFGGPDRYRLVIDFPATSCKGCLFNDIEVALPRFDDALRYSPGLAETQVRTVAFADLDLLQGELWLPLPNGLVGLGGGWWVIKHVRSVHVAARVAPATKVITFSDATAPPDAQRWEFTVIKADQATALDLANRINIWPVVRY